jgi:hypothetical protein
MRSTRREYRKMRQDSESTPRVQFDDWDDPAPATPRAVQTDKDFVRAGRPADRKRFDFALAAGWVVGHGVTKRDMPGGRFSL